ncbi:MAG TPA: response regulator [Actinomycetota bacterium]|nr:response regulator [Actinomycetota bacterium]
MLRLNRQSGRGTIARPLRVLVAAPQPLHRELMRFFLEEEGCQVVALVASGEDAVSLGTSKRPDAVILHESLADTAGAGLIQRVRRGSTSTKIVVVTPQPERAWSGPSRGADAFLEEWVGIQELGIVLHRLCRGTPVPGQPARMQPEPGTASAPPEPGQRRLPLPPRVVNLPLGRRDRWHERLWGAAVASVILILLLLGGRVFQEPATSEGPGPAVSAHLTNAYLTLDVLVASMRGGMSEEVMAETARRLLAERAAALASGADTTRLDAAIDGDVSPLLSTVAHKGAAAVEYVLGDLVSSPESAALPPDWAGAVPQPKGHPNGKVHPQAAAQAGGIGDQRGVAEPGAQRDTTPGAERDSNPGAQGDSNPGPQGDSNPGAQGERDSNPGPQGDSNPGAQGDSKTGAQGDSKTGAQKDSKTGAQPDGDAEAGAQPDGDSEGGAQPDGDAEAGARPDKQAAYTRAESGSIHSDSSGSHVPESAPPVLGTEPGPEMIPVPVDRGRPEILNR